MPISFAISYFDRYRYHRFPVLSKHKEIVGMVTTRDISTRLLWEINHEVENLERMIKTTKVRNGMTREIQTFPIMQHDFENAGFASTEIKKQLKQMEVFPRTIRKAAIASYELEINIAVHSVGGKITAEYGPDEVIITAQDNGPGIEDIDKAMEQGFSTANEWIRSLGFGAGMGLPNIKSVSDQFQITSSPTGTTVTTIIQFSEQEKIRLQQEFKESNRMIPMRDLSKKLGYTIIVKGNEEALVTGGYTGDLLSDVMGNGQEGEILITIQAHKNTIAVASLLGLSGIIICNDRDISDDMKDAAKEHGITLFATGDTQYKASVTLASLLT